MKNKLLILLLFLIPYAMNGQKYSLTEIDTSKERINKVSVETIKYIDTLLRRSEPELRGSVNVYPIFSDATFDKFFEQKISIVNTGKEEINEGNSVSLNNSSKETKLDLNFTAKFSSTFYSGFGVSGKASENIANLFGKGNLNPGITFTHSITYAPKCSRSIHYLLRGAETIYNKRKKYLLNQKDFYSRYYKLKYLELFKSYRHADSLRLQDSTIVQGIDKQNELTKEIDNFSIRDKNSQVIKKSTREIDQNVYDIELSDSGLTRFSFWWFSYNTKYSKMRFDTYNNKYDFAERIGNRYFEKWQFTIAANYFRQKSEWRKSQPYFYFNANVNVNKVNNFEDIEAKDITIHQFKGSQNDTTYEYEEKKTLLDVTNSTYETRWQGRVNVHATRTILNKIIGLDLGITGIYEEKTKPLYEPKVGLIFNFINAADSKSNINFELFFSVKDFSNARKELNIKNGEETIAKRTIFGINITVPFQKLFFK